MGFTEDEWVVSRTGLGLGIRKPTFCFFCWSGHSSIAVVVGFSSTVIGVKGTCVAQMSFAAVVSSVRIHLFPFRVDSLA